MAKETVTETRLNARGQRETGTDLTHEGVTEIAAVLRPLLADAFTLYFKTKNFHWHITGKHFRDYHLLLDEHAEQISAMTDDIEFPAGVPKYPKIIDQIEIFSPKSGSNAPSGI